MFLYFFLGSPQSSPCVLHTPLVAVPFQFASFSLKIGVYDLISSSISGEFVSDSIAPPCGHGENSAFLIKWAKGRRLAALLVRFSSVAQSPPTLCDPMDGSSLGLPVHHQLPEFAQIHVHQVGDAIPPSHPLLSLSPPAFNLSQHHTK